MKYLPMISFLLTILFGLFVSILYVIKTESQTGKKDENNLNLEFNSGFSNFLEEFDKNVGIF